MRALIVVLSLSALTGCFRGRLPVDDDDDGVDAGEGEGEGPQVPDLACPGGAGCSAALDGQPLMAAAAQRDVTPTGFEIARYAYLDRVDDDACAVEVGLYDDGHRHCGVLKDNMLNDCGLDALCASDPGWTAPDTDGTERDGDLTDYWLDCGRDRICPDNAAELDRENGIDDDKDGAVDDGPYEGPDDGEGDGVFQALWIAGYDNNRPAMGVKDPLWARAVVFRQGDTTLALCTVDAVGLFYDEQERIRGLVDDAAPGEVDLFLLQASHTHEAPDTMGQWGFSDPFGGIPDKPGRDDAHMELIRNGCRDAVVEALAERGFRVVETWGLTSSSKPTLTVKGALFSTGRAYYAPEPQATAVPDPELDWGYLTPLSGFQQPPGTPRFVVGVTTRWRDLR